MQRKLLDYNGDQWIKNFEVNFDITTGSLDSAGSSDILDLFILYNQCAHREINITHMGLYRYDCLMVVR